MKIWTIALHTFAGFLRNKLMIVFLSVCVCIVLLMLTPMLGFKMMTTAANAAQMKALVLGEIEAVMFFVSGIGSWLAAWAAADSVASEMKAGTILAVMARPVKRWEFLAGKFLGVMMLMAAYVLMMFGLSWLLAAIGGERIHSSPWVLLVYPMVRYAIWATVAMTLATFFRAIITMGIVALLSIGATVVSATDFASHDAAVRYALYAIYALLPSTDLLSESRFLEITKASLKHTSWLEHATTVAYGLDYALVFLLLAMWSFHYRSLKRD